MWFLATRSFLVKTAVLYNNHSELRALNFWSWPCLMQPRGHYWSGWTAQAGCLLRLGVVTKRADPDAPAAECCPLLHAVAEAVGCRCCPALGGQLVLCSWHSRGEKQPLWISPWGNQSFQRDPEGERSTSNSALILQAVGHYDSILLLQETCRFPRD